MKVALVVTGEMLPVPPMIKTLENWGYVSVVDDMGNPQVHGDHMWLEGPTWDFVRWLGKHDAVWRTIPGTSVMMQQFEVYHIPQILVDEVAQQDSKV